MSDDEKKPFSGFLPPERNYFPMPNVWTDITSEIDSLAELKIIEYVIRHTWGYQEYDITKTITHDEFMFGRKRKDGSRQDKGTGLSEKSVKDGTKRAILHGYIYCEVDDRDRARIKKSYALKMIPSAGGIDSTPQNKRDTFYPSGREIVSPGPGNTTPRSGDSTPRSEKDTNRKTPSKDTNRKKEGKSSVSETEKDATSSSPNSFLLNLSPEARRVHEEWSKMPWFPSNGMGVTVNKTLAKQYEIASAYEPTAEMMLKVKEWATSPEVDKKRYYANGAWYFKAFLNELPGWLSSLPKQASNSNQQDSVSTNAAMTHNEASQLAEDAVTQAQEQGYQVEARAVSQGNDWAVHITWITGKQAKFTVTSRQQWDEEFVGLVEITKIVLRMSGAK